MHADGYHELGVESEIIMGPTRHLTHNISWPPLQLVLTRPHNCLFHLSVPTFVSPSKSLHSLRSYSISILERRYCYDLAFPLLYHVSDSLLIASSYTIQSATKVPCDAEGHGLHVCTLFIYLLV